MTKYTVYVRKNPHSRPRPALITESLAEAERLMAELNSQTKAMLSNKGRKLTIRDYRNISNTAFINY